MSEHEDIARAHRAFGEFTELNAVFDKLENGIFAMLKATPVGANEKVLNLHITLGVIGQVRKALQDIIDNGVVAKAALEAMGPEPRA